MGDMLIFDGHLDLAWNAQQWNRDLTRPIHEIRAAEVSMPGKGRGRGTVSLPEMRRGEVGLCMATILARIARPENPPSLYQGPLIDYASPEIAVATAVGQLHYYRLLEERGWCRMITSVGELNETLSAWTGGTAAGMDGARPVGFVLAMEGADPVLYPDHLYWWYEQGLRVLGLAHYAHSTYAVGTGAEGGLKGPAPALLRVMAELGVVLDLTHLADKGFWQALDLFPGRVLASHNNCRALVPGDRQFSDEQIKVIAEREGVIGVALDAWMLVPDWVRGQTPNTAASLEHLADHIDHICQLVGSANHVAIGSDLDGGFGNEQTPHDVETIAGLQRLVPILTRRGYKTADIARIFYLNWVEFFRSAWA